MKKTKFREIILSSKAKLILGKNQESNDELMKKFEGKDNIILHTVAPGSPFGVIELLKPSKKEIYEAGAYVAKYSQDWRDNKSDVKISIFNGKDISKPIGFKPGAWRVKKSKVIIISKKDIEKL
ncbi:MAG: NFACT RNA binding domain-containing protein [Candidatus Pacearchaeota archaeon]